jgi:hypothetical protein
MHVDPPSPPPLHLYTVYLFTQGRGVGERTANQRKGYQLIGGCFVVGLKNLFSGIILPICQDVREKIILPVVSHAFLLIANFSTSHFCNSASEGWVVASHYHVNYYF